MRPGRRLWRSSWLLWKIQPKLSKKRLSASTRSLFSLRWMLKRLMSNWGLISVMTKLRSWRLKKLALRRLFVRSSSFLWMLALPFLMSTRMSITKGNWSMKLKCMQMSANQVSLSLTCFLFLFCNGLDPTYLMGFIFWLIYLSTLFHSSSVVFDFYSFFIL